MAKKEIASPPPEDIPAWFMTYSDVITLLMTFFILLLTFATTEPERFEKASSSPFDSGGATGVMGAVLKGPVKDSWVSRVRPPSARIAMRGAEMPPIMNDPAQVSFGKGLKSLEPEEHEHNEKTSHHFDVELNRIFNANGELTSQGKQVCATLAVQLHDLPFQASIQFSDTANAPRVAKLLAYMFQEEKTRPGQLSMGMLRSQELPAEKIRITIDRYLSNPS